VRGVLDITFAPDTYFHSDHYTGDERIEVTGTRGYARCNRISAVGIQEPSVVVYREGQTRGYHTLPDRLPDSFAASTAHVLAYLRGEGAAPGAPVMSGEAARNVLATLLAALDASDQGGIVEVPGV